MSNTTIITRWMGFGAKGGGQLGFGGYESTYARLWNLGNGETFDLQIGAARWGIGFGGGGGAVAVIAFGLIEPHMLHGRKLETDWGVNIAFTEKIVSKATIGLVQHGKLYLDAFIAGKYVFTSGKQLENVRNLMHTVFTAFEAIKESGVVVIDLPGGVGLEVSGFITKGTMYVSNESDIAPGSEWDGRDNL